MSTSDPKTNNDNESTSPSIRDHILTSLSTLPSPHRLQLNVLSSIPRRTHSLFPHTPHPPICLEREYLITLSCDVDPGPDSTPRPTPTPTRPAILVSALSAYLYVLPTTSPPTSILYISKLDSSGYSPIAIPFTRTLITSFINYHLDLGSRPTPRVFVQLFARSQGQYLFANSSHGGLKRVVHGLGLCAWWKAVYEEVARRVLTQLPAPHSDGVGGGQVDGIGLRYLLPSYSPQEAEGMLGPSKRPLPTSLNWVYGPSFSTPIIGTSSSTMLSSDHSLATLIPSLPDDPKSRFLDQLVADSAPPDQSPRKSVMVERKGASKKERDEDEKMDAHFALSRVTPEDFWERMGFRQECSSGDVTGFFTLFVDSSTTETETETIHPTEIRSLSTDLKPAITERLLTGLLNVDFGNRSLALEGSAIWLKSVHAIVRDELGEEGWQGCMGEVRGKVGLQSEVRGEKRKDEVVTVLQPRKRKK